MKATLTLLLLAFCLCAAEEKFFYDSVNGHDEVGGHPNPCNTMTVPCRTLPSTMVLQNATKTSLVLSGDFTITTMSFTHSDPENGGELYINGTNPQSVTFIRCATNGTTPCHIQFFFDTLTSVHMDNVRLSNVSVFANTTYLNLYNFYAYNTSRAVKAMLLDAYNSVFSHNHIAVSADVAQFINCQFISNTGTHGAAIHMNNQSTSVVIADCFFFNNTAKYGGAIYSAASQSVITYSSFVNNSALEAGGGVWGSFDVDFTINACFFTQNTVHHEHANTSEGRGGGVWVQHRDPAAQVIITNSKFQKNSAKIGGGMYIDILKGIFTNTTFHSNQESLGLDVDYPLGQGSECRSPTGCGACAGICINYISEQWCVDNVTRYSNCTEPQYCLISGSSSVCTCNPGYHGPNCVPDKTSSTVPAYTYSPYQPSYKDPHRARTVIIVCSILFATALLLGGLYIFHKRRRAQENYVQL